MGEVVAVHPVVEFKEHMFITREALRVPSIDFVTQVFEEMDKMGYMENTFVGTCDNCDQRRPFCKTLVYKDTGAMSTFCLGCLGIEGVSRLQWKVSGSMPMMNLNPPPVPNSPWGHNNK